MEVTVKYQGIIADLLHRKSQQVEMSDGATVDDLLARLTKDDERSQAILKQTRAFIDGKQADRAAPLNDGAEVIFMRPIAGGCGLRVTGKAPGLKNRNSQPATQNLPSLRRRRSRR